MARCPFERLKQMKRDIFHIFPSFFRLGAEIVGGWESQLYANWVHDKGFRWVCFLNNQLLFNCLIACVTMECTRLNGWNVKGNRVIAIKSTDEI